jgi:transcriptional regulator with XRE-family HTH domain
MKTGLAIARRREELGMSQVDLAKVVGVSKASVCRWESGDISNMKRDKIHKLADALRISPIDLLCEETEGFTLIEDNITISNSAVEKETPLEPIALKASKSEWIYILERMSDENLIKLRDYARLLLLSQEKGGQGDQESRK